MDSYEAEIARQPGGPFSTRRERQTIRLVARDWIERQQFSEERWRRFKRYAGYVTVGGPVILVGIKVVESLLGR